MNRYHIVAKEVQRNLEEKCYGIKKQEGYQHLYSVATLCIILAKKRHLDPELAGIMGICHDYSTYYYGNSFDHANRSAYLINEMLQSLSLFEEGEIDTIITAIKKHSNKKEKDAPYSELLKDADSYCLAILEPDMTNPPERQQRIQEVEQLLTISSDKKTL